ncbi:MAG: S8 family serine peptidase [Thermoleophilaceae bacterium]
MRAKLPICAAGVLCAGLLVLPAAAAAGGYVPGEVIVKYERGATAAERADVQAGAGVGASSAVGGGARTLQVLDGEGVGETVAELRRDPRVASAVPNYLARASAFLPNDPGDGTAGEWQALQWNFSGPAGVNAPDAWELARLYGAPGGRGVVVAVIDSGLAYRTRGRFRRAPDIRPRRVARGWDFVEGDRRPDDENGHGTHVAGTIAQQTNNGAGLTGLAYGAKIMPLRVLDAIGEGDAADIARAIRFAVRRGADVINLSLEFDGGQVRSSSQIPDVVGALRYARRRGVVVVGASGNQAGRTVAYPARARHVISVGATTEHGCGAVYSNTGSGLDLVAPGGGDDYTLSGAQPDGPRDAHCSGGGGRDIFQQTFTTGLRRFGFPSGYEGTSMAAPHVSAAAALVIATKRLGEDPSPVEVERRLEQTARDLGAEGADPRYGAGLLDAAAALGP